MKKASTILMLVAAAAWSCSQETPLGVDTDVSASRSGREVKMVPFAGHHHALVVDASGVSCPAGQTAGRSTIPEGEATHLGRFTGGVTSCAVGITFTSAVSTWIGANGDQVSLHLDTGAGQIVVIEFPVATVTTEWDIAGGTGRFDGASGRVVIVTVFNLVTSTNQSTWEGLISAPGSIKWSN